MKTPTTKTPGATTAVGLPRHASAPNAKRASLTATLASGAAVTRMRAGIGGGAAVPTYRPQRGSNQWLRNRDAIVSNNHSSSSTTTMTTRMRAAAHFSRRTTPASQIQQLRAAAAAEEKRLQQQLRDDDQNEEEEKKRKKKAKGSAAAQKAATEEESSEGSSEGSSSSSSDNDAEDEEEDALDHCEDDQQLLELLAAVPSAESAGAGGAAGDDGLSELERVAWETWHWSNERLEAAGYDPAAVRAPDVLAAVRTRFIHSPNIMLNSNFDCRFSVDQAAFKRILRTKYGYQATYTPVKYPGLCCPFYLRRGVPLDPLLQTGIPDAQDAVGSAAFVRKYVKATFILFRTGNAFLRGSFSEEVIEFVYKRFQRILVDEYPHIVARTTCADTKDHRAVVKTRVVYFSRRRPAAATADSIKQEEGGGIMIKHEKKE